MVALKDVPATIETVRRQAQFGRKHVHRSKREQAQGGFSSRDSVYNFVDRAVSAGSDDFLETFVRGVTGQCFRFARTRSSAQDRPAGERFYSIAPTICAVAACRRIENDDGLIHWAIFFRAFLRASAA